MKPSAIVYTSNAGHTAEYAKLLSEKTSLPAYSLSKAQKKLPGGNGIIYLGWLMAGRVQGYKKAQKRYCVCAVCGVGMGASGSQLQDLQKANSFSQGMPVFTLQGGFEISKLHGVYKLMMNIMAKTAGKGLRDKKDRTPDEDAMLEMMINGKNTVSDENLAKVLAWYQKCDSLTAE